MGTKIIKKFFSKKKIYFCDRCGGLETEDWTSFKTLCGSCYSKSPETVKPQTISDNFYFSFGLGESPPENLLCSVCQKMLGKYSDFEKIDCKHVCICCVSKHPDTTHHDFDETIPDHFLKKKEGSTVLVRHCISCGGAMVIHINSSVITCTYYKVGSMSPSTKPFICKKNHPAQDSCVHNWIMIAGSERNKGAPIKEIREIRNHPDPITQMSYSAYLTDQRHWCSKCGNFYQVPRERLPVRGDL